VHHVGIFSIVRKLLVQACRDYQDIFVFVWWQVK